MNSPSDSLHEFSRALGKCSAALLDDFDKPPLRILQKSARSIHGDKNPLSLVPLAFLLDMWIDDFYYNFVGDILSSVSEEIDDVRSAFLKQQISPTFGKMALMISSNELSAALEVFGELMIDYVEAVTEANKRIII